MKLGHTLKAGFALAAVVAAASAAQAAAVTYFGTNPNAGGGVVDAGAGADPVNQRNRFRDSLVSASVKVESFGMPTGLTSTVNNLFSDSGISLSATPAANSSPIVSRVQNNYFGSVSSTTWTGRFNTTGDLTSLPVNPVSTSGWFETNKSSVEVTFGTAVSAFGTFLIDVGDFNGALTVQVFAASGRLLSEELIPEGAGSLNGGLAFFGYTNTTQFNRVLFSITQASGATADEYDFIGFDDFITGTLPASGGSVPEPGSLALVGLSLALLGYSRRRQTQP